ncbi:hypothetical protein PPACK8108_LOCUS21339 [Phakopsora pachyrhizi]|uniref:Uncharacterized protein n=1 Tax=Phakopsora pachyrhizi TaxID=170000 RepID=A0AAV0BK16_PHAPC|nr:hypothetical protein PPACK8108_LOCUS21339 [Phakopsora pachyrhizi]
MVVVDLDDAEVKLEMISEVVQSQHALDIYSNVQDTSKASKEEESEVLMVRLKEAMRS